MGSVLPTLEKWEAILVAAVLTVGAIGLASTLQVDVLAETFALLGFVVLLPLIGILGDRLPFVADGDGTTSTESATADHGRDADPVTTSGGGDGDEDDALATLRQRYARGEIDEREFERRLEALLETEDVDVPSASSGERATELE